MNIIEIANGIKKGLFDSFRDGKGIVRGNGSYFTADELLMDYTPINPRPEMTTVKSTLVGVVSGGKVLEIGTQSVLQAKYSAGIAAGTHVISNVTVEFQAKTTDVVKVVKG